MPDTPSETIDQALERFITDGPEPRMGWVIYSVESHWDYAVVAGRMEQQQMFIGYTVTMVNPDLRTTVAATERTIEGAIDTCRRRVVR